MNQFLTLNYQTCQFFTINYGNQTFQFLTITYQTCQFFNNYLPNMPVLNTYLPDIRVIKTILPNMAVLDINSTCQTYESTNI